jgi:hypothetical protein
VLGIFDGVDLSHLQREGKKPRQDELQHQKRALVAVELLSIKRTLKPLADAQETQRRERVQLLGDAAEALAIPRSYVQAPPRPAAADLFHKPNYQLQALRSDIPLPAHSTIQQYRLQQAPLDGTETRTFVTQRDGADIHVSYLTDPQLFILRHVAQSKWLAVGADRGGPATKIGITYERHGHMTYAPLVVSTGKDDWTGLSVLGHSPSPFQLTGSSTHFTSYLAVLQWVIDGLAAFLNGDWNGINAVLGLSTPAATWGCPICLAPCQDRLTLAPLRTPQQLQADLLLMLGGDAVPWANHSLVNMPLLKVPAERIVPLPLHIFLGLANLIILEVYPTMVGEETVRQHVAAVKGRHVEGMLGAESVFQLTGPELSRWVKQQRDEALARHADTLLRPRARVRFVLGGQRQQQQPLPLTTPAARIRTLGSWLRLLHDQLLHRDQWTPADVDALEAVQQDIWKRWQSMTGRAPTPKVHMLRHTVDFARRFRVLGLLSEAQIEACHAPFNAAYNITHRNSSQNDAERLRRSHVEVILSKVQG